MANKQMTRSEFLKDTTLAACGLAVGVRPALGREKAEGGNEVVTSTGAKMVRLPGGEFVMGDAKGVVDETPHTVLVDTFLVDTHLVTQDHFKRITGENIARWKGPRNPVEQVRWSDAARYCNARSTAEGLQPCYDLSTWTCDFEATGYRLPTEAEWEYACRAETSTRWFFGDDPAKLKSFAWFEDNSGGRPRPVGQKLPNPWGLYDMYGDVWEWCHDYYAVDYYEESLAKNPRGPESGDTRVLRGGCFDSQKDECRSSYRYNEDPGYSDICFGYDIYGFRSVRRA